MAEWIKSKNNKELDTKINSLKEEVLDKIDLYQNERLSSLDIRLSHASTLIGMLQDNLKEFEKNIKDVEDRCLEKDISNYKAVFGYIHTVEKTLSHIQQQVRTHNIKLIISLANTIVLAILFGVLWLSR